MSYGQGVVVKDEATGVPLQITSKGVKVDTELTLSGDISIGNVTVARNDAGTEKKIRVDNNNNIRVVTPGGVPLGVSGDSLVAIKDAVEIIDDWDESDRAKVNPIVGKAGVAADAGKSSDTTQRITLADDDKIGTQISGDTAKLAGALDSEDSDEIRVILTDPTTSSNKQTVNTDGSAKISGDVNIAGIGSPQQRAVVSVSDTAVEVAINSGKRHMEIYNEGTGDIYWGASDVTSLTGIPLFDDYSREFNNCQSSFSVYLRCAAGATATARIVEYA